MDKGTHEQNYNILLLITNGSNISTLNRDISYQNQSLYNINYCNWYWI